MNIQNLLDFKISFEETNNLVEPHIKLPNIQITSDKLQPNNGHKERNLFLPVHISIFKQLTQVFYEKGFLETLILASSLNNVFLSKGACFLLNIINFLKGIYIFMGFDLPPCEELIEEISQTKNWNGSIVKSIAWHPNTFKLALATCDDCIRIYNVDQPQNVPIISCKQMRNITHLAWRPYSMSELAVAHEDGILVWNLESNSLITRPSINNAIILKRDAHQPVTNVTWSIRGELLISAAGNDSNLLVWNVELDDNSLLKGGGCGNSLVKLSPKGDYMLSVTDKLVFKIWNCNTWDFERWTVLSGRVQSACWINNGNHILFATNVQPMIYLLTVENNLIFSNQTHSSANEAIPIFDLSRVEIEGCVVGGLIQCLESNLTGTHLAVIFKDSNYVLIFHVFKQNCIKLMPISLIKGLYSEIPAIINFQLDLKGTICLTIVWSSGRIQYCFYEVQVILSPPRL